MTLRHIPLTLAISLLPFSLMAEEVAPPSYLMNTVSDSGLSMKPIGLDGDREDYESFKKDKTKKISLLEVIASVDEKKYITALSLIDQKMNYTMKHEGKSAAIGLALDLNIKGDILYAMGEFSQASEVYKRSLLLSEPRELEEAMFASYSQLAICAEKENQYATAIKYNDQAISTGIKNEALVSDVWLAYLSSAHYYRKLELVDQAKASLTLAEKSAPSGMLPVVLIAKAQFFVEQKEYVPAIAVYMSVNVLLEKAEKEGTMESSVAENAIRLNNEEIKKARKKLKELEGK